MGVVLGIDVSTTATKAILVDEGGRVSRIASSEHGFDQPNALWNEQDSHPWWSSDIDAIHRALCAAGLVGDDVVAVGLTGQMHGPSSSMPRARWSARRSVERPALTGFTAPKLVRRSPAPRAASPPPRPGCAGTPVAAGGGDQAANAAGVGAVVPGRVALSLGTSGPRDLGTSGPRDLGTSRPRDLGTSGPRGMIFATTDRSLHEPVGRVHALCHAVPGRWHCCR